MGDQQEKNLACQNFPQIDLKHVLDQTFEGVQVIDFDYRYLYLNPTVAKQGKTTVEALLGRTMMEAYPGIETTEMFERLQQCMRSRQPDSLLNQFQFQDGSDGWFELKMQPVEQGVCIFSIDVTRLMLMQKELMQKEDFLSTTLDCMGEGVMTLDLERRVQSMNVMAEVITNSYEFDAINQPLNKILPLKIREEFTETEQALENIFSERFVLGHQQELWLEVSDKENIPISLKSSPLFDKQGAVSGAVIVFRSIRDELLLSARLNQQQKMEALGRMAGGIAHDFNNLLTVICGLSDLELQMMNPKHSRFDSIEQINLAGKKAKALTQQLLTFSRNQQLQPVELKINQVVSEMGNILRPLLGDEVKYNFDFQADLPRIKLDKSQLEQIILNLVVNAGDAMPKGGYLHIQTSHQIFYKAYIDQRGEIPAGQYVCLSVSDTGMGMSPEVQSRIFEPFYSTKAEGYGTGLGLATLFGIVQQSNGHIWVYSEPEKGTTFKIYFPVLNPKPLSTNQPLGPDLKLGKERILVVEDDLTVLEFMLPNLEMLGYEVLSAQGGAKAIEKFTEDEFDLLITDVIMPHIGGKEVAEHFLSVQNDLNVLYLSGYSNDTIIQYGILDGAADILLKPFTFQELSTKIRSIFDRRQLKDSIGSNPTAH